MNSLDYNCYHCGYTELDEYDYYRYTTIGYRNYVGSLDEISDEVKRLVQYYKDNYGTPEREYIEERRTEMFYFNLDNGQKIYIRINEDAKCEFAVGLRN